MLVRVYIPVKQHIRSEGTACCFTRIYSKEDTAEELDYIDIPDDIEIPIIY